MLISILLIILTLLSGCGAPSGGNVTPPDVIVPVPTIPPLPSLLPSPSPTPSPTPSCKALGSSWSTTDVPKDALTGYYPSTVATSNPIFVLDLTHLKLGQNNSFPIQYDTTHTCYYDITLTANHYSVDAQQGCNPQVIPPGGSLNDACSYCPSAGGTYDYSQTCNSLNIIDVQYNHVLGYF